MIILEGLDNTGKTTLAETILRDFPELKGQPSIGNKHDTDQIRRQAHDALAVDGIDPMVVWDRSRFISEYVYNPILKNRPTAYDVDTWCDLIKRYTQRPQLFIYCFRTRDRLLRDFDEREQLPGVLENLDALELQYEAMMTYLGLLFRFRENGSAIYAYSYDHESKQFKYPVIRKGIENYIRLVERDSV